MQKVLLSLCFILVIPICSLAQDSKFMDEVTMYLQHNGTVGQYEYAYDGLLKMLQNQYPETDANNEGWTYLRENRKTSVDQMMALLVPIYQKHFDQGEIQNMNGFYMSPAGRQLVKDRSQMTEEQKKELNSYYNSPLGKKVLEKQTVLSQEISMASENWSRDLYETAVSLLK